jgi:hypothetical protein
MQQVKGSVCVIVKLDFAVRLSDLPHWVVGDIGPSIDKSGVYPFKLHPPVSARKFDNRHDHLSKTISQSLGFLTHTSQIAGPYL